MATRAKRLAESWPYIPLADRELPVEQQTTFRLSPLTGPERAEAKDGIAITTIEPDGTKTSTSRERQTALRLCVQKIIAVENFPAGEPEPWPTGRSERERYLDGMDDELVREVGGELFMRSNIGELEKNSSRPARTSSSDAPSPGQTSTTAEPAPATPT